MTVEELIAILEKLPSDLNVATHANNHTFTSWGEEKLRVGLLVKSSYADADPRQPEGSHEKPPSYVVIGNLSKRDLNYPNEWVTEMVDGERPLAFEWGRSDDRLNYPWASEQRNNDG